jgi:hypothetical protein
MRQRDEFYSQRQSVLSSLQIGATVCRKRQRITSCLASVLPGVDELVECGIVQTDGPADFGEYIPVCERGLSQKIQWAVESHGRSYTAVI